MLLLFFLRWKTKKIWLIEFKMFQEMHFVIIATKNLSNISLCELQTEVKIFSLDD